MPVTEAPTIVPAAGDAPTHRSTRRRPTRRRSISVLVGLATVVATVALNLSGAAPASAWFYDGTTGVAGAVTQTNQVQMTDVPTYTVYGTVYQAAFVAGSGPVVTRSAATTGAQDVYLAYTVQRYNGSTWDTAISVFTSSRIGAGVSQIRMGGLSVIPKTTKGYYRVLESFYWFPAGAAVTSTPLGFTTIVPHLVSDMACSTRLRPCAAYAGYVQFGALGGGW